MFIVDYVVGSGGDVIAVVMATAAAAAATAAINVSDLCFLITLISNHTENRKKMIK